MRRTLLRGPFVPAGSFSPSILLASARTWRGCLLGPLLFGFALLALWPRVAHAQSVVGNGITVVIPVAANTISFTSEITVTNVEPPT